MTKQEILERLQAMLDFSLAAGAQHDAALDNFEEQIDGFINELTPTPDEKFKAWLKREGKMHKNVFYRFGNWLLEMVHAHYDISWTIETW